MIDTATFLIALLAVFGLAIVVGLAHRDMTAAVDRVDRAVSRVDRAALSFANARQTLASKLAEAVTDLVRNRRRSAVLNEPCASCRT